jgi:hypothetical protein
MFSLAKRLNKVVTFKFEWLCGLLVCEKPLDALRLNNPFITEEECDRLLAIITRCVNKASLFCLRAVSSRLCSSFLSLLETN